MTRQKARGSFTNVSGKAETLDEQPDGSQLLVGQWSARYTGDIDGSATTHILQAKLVDGTSTLCAIERIEGTVGDRSGSFLNQQDGTRGGSTWHGRFWVIPGSGTGGLSGLRGEGQWDLGDTGSWTLDYWFE